MAEDLVSLISRIERTLTRVESRLEQFEKHIPLKRRAEMLGVHPSTLRRWKRKSEMRRKLEDAGL